MGSIAAVHAMEVMERVWTILAMEWMAGTRALDHSGRETGPFLSGLIDAYRAWVPAAQGDRVLADEIEVTKQFLQSLPIEDEDFLRFELK